MKPLYNETEFNNAKSNDKLPCECYYCGKTFNTLKKLIKFELNNQRGRIKFCSTYCNSNYQNKKKLITCFNCGESIVKKQSQLKKNKNNFCSQSCAASYNNKHKSTGIRRSKLEIWLEDKLMMLYPTLKMNFNKKDIIGSELDIYIPNLNLAFELNGIFHYEPIYGISKLNKIKENDKNKFKLCIEHKIDLCIIDVSSQKYFKETTSQKFLKIITDIINERLSTT